MGRTFLQNQTLFFSEINLPIRAMGTRPDQKENFKVSRSLTSADADRQSCEIERKVAPPGSPGSIWYPGPTSRDRTQEPRIAEEPRPLSRVPHTRVG